MEPRLDPNNVNYKGFTNNQCSFYPCHKPHEEFNCLFCYCPLVFLECKGIYTTFVDKHGLTRKDCTNCHLPHHGYENSWKFIQRGLEQPIIWKQHAIK